MNTWIAPLLSASLAITAVTPAFAVSARPVRGSFVGQSENGRSIVNANGALYVQLQPSEYQTQTAQEMYEAYRTEFRALMATSEAADPDPDRDMTNDERAGKYSELKTHLPLENSFYGFSISSGQVIRGTKYVVTRDDRLTNPAYPSSDDYILAETPDSQGAVATANCRNPQGTPDVIGLNAGHSGCGASLKLFKKF